MYTFVFLHAVYVIFIFPQVHPQYLNSYIYVMSCRTRVHFLRY